MVQGNLAGLTCSEELLPCPDNAIVSIGKNNRILCDHGYSFSDGSLVKSFTCDVVTDKNGQLKAEWSEPGICTRKYHSTLSNFYSVYQLHNG